MTRITVKVPATVKAFIDNEIASGAFPSAEDMICHLLREAKKRKNEEKAEARSRVEALIDESLKSGDPFPMPADYFEKKRQLLPDRPLDRKKK